MLKCHKQCCNIHYSSFANLAHQSGKALVGKKPFLLISEILRPFFNTLTADGKYFAENRDNLRQLIQMKLYKKLKIFSQLFASFLKSSFNFKDFQKKGESHSLSISEMIG